MKVLVDAQALSSAMRLLSQLPYAQVGQLLPRLQDSVEDDPRNEETEGTKKPPEGGSDD